MKKIIHCLIVCLAVSNLYAQNRPAYQIYTKEGKKVDYGKLLRGVKGATIVFFGELHDNPIAHWLQLELTTDLHAQHGDKLVLGAEMIEADNQQVLNDYLSGKLSQKQLAEGARLWKNYKTDYKPLVDFAKEKGLPFVATNIPRKYASMVSAGGFESLDSLPDEAKRAIAPLPIAYDPDLSGYKSMLGMGGMHGSSMVDMKNFPKAQAIKDATMSFFILKNLNPGNVLIHFNGAYHSNNYEGIVWYIRKAQPAIRISTITTVTQKSTNRLEKANERTADFIIVVPENMTRTY